MINMPCLSLFWMSSVPVEPFQGFFKSTLIVHLSYLRFTVCWPWLLLQSQFRTHEAFGGLCVYRGGPGRAVHRGRRSSWVNVWKAVMMTITITTTVYLLCTFPVLYGLCHGVIYSLMWRTVYQCFLCRMSHYKPVYVLITPCCVYMKMFNMV